MSPSWQPPDVRDPESDRPICSHCLQPLLGSTYCRHCHQKDHPLATAGCAYCDRVREERRGYGGCEVCGERDYRNLGFCVDCHDREHPAYIAGCGRCQTRTKYTYESKHMPPGRRAVEGIKNTMILVGVIAGIAAFFAIFIAIDKARDDSGESSATDYACAAVLDYVNGDDTSSVLSDLQGRIDDADYSGESDEEAKYQSAYDVIAFGDESELANWVRACS